jgi:hypothetical protein
MKRWLTMLLVIGVALTGFAQDEPEVLFLNLLEDAIIRDVVNIEAEGKNFPDLQSFGFADFLYSDDGGESFTTIGRDGNTFDGLSLSWDTNEVPDGEYLLRIEVTDLTNTMGNGTQRVFVNNRGNDSFSNRMLDILSDLFGALGQALNSPDDIDISEAVSVIQENLGAASVTVQIAFDDTQAINDELPQSVRNQDSLLQRIPLFSDIMRAYLGAEAGIKNLAIAEAQTAFIELSVLMETLSTLKIGSVDFSQLEPVADALSEASGKLDQLLASIQGEGDSSSDAVLGEFIELTRIAVPILVDMSQAMHEADVACPVSFSDSVNDISVQYALDNTERMIHVGDRAVNGELVIFDAEGSTVYETPFEQPFIWDRAGSNESPLDPATYYFRIELGDASGDIKTGRLVIVP